MSTVMKTATVLRHVHFEDLGSLAPVLADLGYKVRYHSVGDPDFLAFDPADPDLLVVLGGPIGVYEVSAYPFIEIKRQMIAARLAKRRPTLGICLGAQLIAAALGSRVYPSGIKEIGFSALALSDNGLLGPLRHLEDVPVLHWHGDTYELPPGSVHLAATAQVQQQAFAIDHHVLALQFHPEVDAREGLERWLVGHASELAVAGVDVRALRGAAQRHGDGLVNAADRLFRDWLAGLSQ